MDFGIAHAASGTKLTQTGMVIGTPGYPEKAPTKKQRKGSGLKTFAWLLFILLLILAGVYGVNYYQQQEAAKAKRAEYAFYSNALSYNTQQAYNQ